MKASALQNASLRQLVEFLGGRITNEIPYHSDLIEWQDIRPEMSFICKVPRELESGLEGGLTLRDMWLCTPCGEAIKFPSYLHFCNVLTRETKMSLPAICRRWPDIWNMKPQDAIAFVIRWAASMRSLDSLYFDKLAKETREIYFS